jgi:hypothetical protein
VGRGQAVTGLFKDEKIAGLPEGFITGPRLFCWNPNLQGKRWKFGIREVTPGLQKNMLREMSRHHAGDTHPDDGNSHKTIPVEPR